MDKFYKIIIIFEVILLLIFLIGYAIYETNNREIPSDNCIDYENYPLINIINSNDTNISISLDKKEDLNS